MRTVPGCARHAAHASYGHDKNVTALKRGEYAKAVQYFSKAIAVKP